MSEKAKIVVEQDSNNTEAPEAPESAQTPEQGAEATQEPEGQESGDNDLYEGIPEDHPIRKVVEDLRKENASRRTLAKTVKEENEKLQEQLKEAKTPEEIQELTEQYQAQIQERETELLRERIARKHRVPDDYLEFLTATSEEELESQAQKLKSFSTGTPAPTPTPTGGLNPKEAPLTASDIADQVRKQRRRGRLR